MSRFSVFGALAFPACFALAGVRGGAVLDYTIKVRMEDETTWTQGGFRVLTTPALVTGNKVKKPRMGGWRVEALPNPPGSPGGAPSAALLARVTGLLYFSGPSAGLTVRDSGMRLGNRFCRLWQVQSPPRVPGYIYLAEVAPHLLALSYLSVKVDEGGVAALEIHLVKAELGSRPSPAEEGTTLLRTLQRWQNASPKGLVNNVETLESEEID